MKNVRFIGLVLCSVIFIACESTQTAGEGNQEAKRRAALEQARANEQPDEAQRNLWNTQQDRINRDGSNPTGGRY